MINSFIETVKNKSIMPFAIVSVLLIMVYLYAGFSGWKFFGKTTENWSPEGKHTRTHK